jgi:hypothetical protein
MRGEAHKLAPGHVFVVGRRARAVAKLGIGEPDELVVENRCLLLLAVFEILNCESYEPFEIAARIRRQVRSKAST